MSGDLSDDEIDGYYSSYAFDCSYDHPDPDTFDSPQSQNFSLPSTLIYYISMNPKSPKGLEKLQKTCKYFFAKNKIVVLREGVTAEGDALYCYGIYFAFETNYIKYWLTKSIEGYGDGDYLKEDIYRCTFKSFHYGRQNFTWNEFNFLLGDGKIRDFGLDDCKIYDDISGERIPIDQILAKVPHVRDFNYESRSEMIDSKTFENLCFLKFTSKLETIDLGIWKISKVVDFTNLCKFFQQNAAEKFAFRVSFYKIENALKYMDDLENKCSDWAKRDGLSIEKMSNETLEISKE